MAYHFIHRLGPLVVGVVEASAKSEAAFDTAVVTKACLVLEGLLDMVAEGQSKFCYGNSGCIPARGCIDSININNWRMCVCKMIWSHVCVCVLVCVCVCVYLYVCVLVCVA